MIDPTEARKLRLNDEVASALWMRANYIETGNPEMSLKEATRELKGLVNTLAIESFTAYVHFANQLSEDDRRRIIMLREYAAELEQSE